MGCKKVSKSTTKKLSSCSWDSSLYKLSGVPPEAGVRFRCCNMTTSVDSAVCSINAQLAGFDVSVLKKSIVGFSAFLKKNDSSDLLDTRGKTVTLMFNLAKIPPAISSKPVPINLPFPIHFRADTRVCLIVRNPQKKWKEKIAELWISETLNNVEPPKVIGLAKLKSDYPTASAKRTLCRSYDIFLCDNRIIEQMPHLLGRSFITAGKLPLDVRVRESNLLEPIVQRLKQTFMSIRTGPSLSVKIGFAQDSPKSLYRNALSTIETLSSYFVTELLPENDTERPPTKAALLRLNEIKSIYLTATECPALPVFVHPSLTQAVEAVIQSKKNSSQEESEAEESKIKTSRCASVSQKIKKRRHV